MSKRSSLFVAAAAAVAAAFSVRPAMADPTLKVGDDAPTPAFSEFFKGEPVKQFDKGKVYVLDFWATWCGPCKVEIPLVTELQKAHPDATFIGCDIGEPAADAAPFVKKMGDKMDYRVAHDDDGKTNSAYLQAAGLHTIPTAVIVNQDGKIAWFGDPKDMKKPLERVLAGTFDMKLAAARGVRKAKLDSLLENEDFDAADKMATEVAKVDPEQAEAMDLLHFQILITGKHDDVAAAKKAGELAPKIKNADSLNMMAWRLVTVDVGHERSAAVLATAQRLADKAVASDPSDARMYDTAARVAGARKDWKRAAELETTAVDKCTSDNMKAMFTEALGSYKAERIPTNE